MPEDGRFTVHPGGGSLTITEVGSEDEGLYVCVAKNGAGERSASAELLIKPRGNQVLRKCKFLSPVYTGAL